jgi:hypothetical protein
MGDAVRPCNYPRHAMTAWRLAGSETERWTSGVCHPPADRLEVETVTGAEPVRASEVAARVQGEALDRS